MIVRLRPHHILCSIGYEGSQTVAGTGYDDAFAANLSHVFNGQLRGPDGKDCKILVTDHADTICAPCPRRIGLGCGRSDEIDGRDAAHAEILDLAPGNLLTRAECLGRVRERVRPNDLDDICAGCRWLPLGTCKAAVAHLTVSAGAAWD